MPVGSTYRPETRQQSVLRRGNAQAQAPPPKPAHFGLGKAAAGGSVLRRGTFQPENRKQQASLAQGVQQNAAEQSRQQQRQAAQAQARKLYAQGRRAEAIKLAQSAGLGIGGGREPISSAYGEVQKVERGKYGPVAAGLVSAVDPAAAVTSILGSRKAAHQYVNKPTLRGALQAVTAVAPLAVMGGGRGGGLPKALDEAAAVGRPPHEIQAEMDRIKNDPESWTRTGATPHLTPSAGRRFMDLQYELKRPTGSTSGRVGGASPSAPVPQEVAAAAKVRESLGPARARRAAQEGLYREERGKRIGRAQSASERAGGGEAGFAAAKEQLRGELPKVKFQHLREGNLSQDEFHTLLTQVQNHPDLTPWEKIPAQQALLDAFREGKTPQKAQIRHLQTVFGQDAAAEIVKTSKLVKAGKITMGTLNIPRTMMASYDLSAPLRQGLVAGVSHPTIWGKNFKAMLKYAKSEDYYQKTMDEIGQRPNADLYHSLALTDLGKEAGLREEQFPSEYAEHIPLVGSGVRVSARAYTGFLNKMRVDIFDHLIEKARRQGHNVEDRKFQRQLAQHVNAITGRGSLGKAESWGPFLNTVMFSPRLMASRLNVLGYPVTALSKHPFVRNQELKSFGKLAAFGAGAGAVGAAAGGKVGYDPRSSDFGKIKFGNTRIDPLGGFSQYLVAASKLATGKSISSTTGQVSRLGPGMGQLGRKDIAERFLAGKATPTVGLLYDLLNQKTFQGQPLSVQNEVLPRLVPLALQDAYGLYQDKGNIPLGAAGYAASGFGLGVQTYGPRQIVKGVEKTGKQLPQTLTDAAKKAGIQAQITPEMKREIKVLTARQAAYGQIRQTKGSLTPADRFVSDVNLLVKNGIGNAAQAKEAAQWAKTAKPSDLTRAREKLARQYFSFPSLNYAVKVLKDHGQTVKLPSGG